jgi:fumarate reductase flavoprotein subunit
MGSGGASDARVVVIGAGTAGLAAAVELAVRGERVELVEAGDDVGGALHVSWGQMSAAGTRLQSQRGIDDTPDEHFDDVMRISHGTANRTLVRKAVDLAASTIDWLMEHDFDMHPDCPALHYYHEPYSKPRTYWGTAGGKSVLEVLERRRSATWGEHQSLSLGTRVVDLDAEGTTIRAVHVMGPDGESRVLRPEAVILATGGYGANPELFRRLTDGHDVISPAAPTSDGSGIEIAMGLGGRIVGGDLFLPTFGGIEDPSVDGRAIPLDDFPQLTPQDRRPWELFVDQRGLRFCDEDGPSVDVKEHALLGLPGLQFWIVYDERIRREAPPLLPTWSTRRIEDAFTGSDPSFVSGQTLADLAGSMGVPAAELEATVGAYNSAQRSGSDDAFGREHRPTPIEEGPFYAVRNRAVALKSPAGLAVDEELRVLRADGASFDNFFAAGEAIGGATLSGRSFVGGMSVTPAISFGRLLGRTI